VSVHAHYYAVFLAIAQHLLFLAGGPAVTFLTGIEGQDLVDMAGKGVEYPSVFVVDSRTGIPPLPPKPGQRLAQNRRNRTTQIMLFILVSMALLGIVVEACFIYHLYKTKHGSEPDEVSQAEKPSAQRGEHIVVSPPTPPKTRPPPFKKPTKPLAHLMAGREQPGTDGVMPWTVNVEHDFHQVEYTENKLVVQKEGYYYIYSKLTFDGDKDSFTHLMVMTTKRFASPFPIELLRYRYHRNVTKPPKKEGLMLNSYLGGVFHFFKGDAVFVLVRNGTIRLQTAADNYFGMFML
ncbi:hypothetical protein NFI96_027201, partial [Prochilodus magdalenae]